jgi:hypothetical protein
MWENGNAYRILVRKPTGKRPLVRPRHRLGINSKIEFRDIVLGGKDWIWPKIGTDEHSNEPSGSIKFWEILKWLSDWRLPKKGSAHWS